MRAVKGLVGRPVPGAILVADHRIVGDLVVRNVEWLQRPGGNVRDTYDHF
jgi:hypothetical protein